MSISRASPGRKSARHFQGYPKDRKAGLSTRPISYLSFGLNYLFGGTEVFGYHVVNFVIHFAAAILCSSYLQHPSAASSSGPLRGTRLRHCPSGDLLLGDEPLAGPRRDDRRPTDGSLAGLGTVMARTSTSGRGRQTRGNSAGDLLFFAPPRRFWPSGRRKCGHAADLDPPVRRRAGPGSDAG